MKKIILFLLILFGWVGSLTVSAQDRPVLYKTILHMDSVLFDAFNGHNLVVLKTVFAENAEFYHDKGGFSNYQATMDNFSKVFSLNPDLHRDLDIQSLEVYPIPGYGAVEIGMHHFTVTQNGHKISSIFKFVHTWQYKDGQWKVTRAISVGH